MKKVLEFDNIAEIQSKFAAQSFTSQLKILFDREIKLSLRNKMKLVRGVMISMMMTIIIGLIFIKVVSDNRPNSSSIYEPIDLIKYFVDAQGVSFICVTSMIMNGLNSVILVFPTEREVFAKETSSKTYTTLPYFISKVFFELLNIWMIVILFCCGAYWILGYTATLSNFLCFGTHFR